MEITIGGHVYQVKDLTEMCGRETASQYVAMVTELAEPMNEYDKRVHLLSQVVTGWDWPGQPTNLEDWECVPHHHQFQIIVKARDVFLNPKN